MPTINITELPKDLLEEVLTQTIGPKFDTRPMIRLTVVCKHFYTAVKKIITSFIDRHHFPFYFEDNTPWPVKAYVMWSLLRTLWDFTFYIEDRGYTDISLGTTGREIKLAPNVEYRQISWAHVRYTHELKEAFARGKHLHIYLHDMPMDITWLKFVRPGLLDVEFTFVRSGVSPDGGGPNSRKRPLITALYNERLYYIHKLPMGPRSKALKALSPIERAHNARYMYRGEGNDRSILRLIDWEFGPEILPVMPNAHALEMLNIRYMDIGDWAQHLHQFTHFVQANNVMQNGQRTYIVKREINYNELIRIYFSYTGFHLTVSPLNNYY